MTDIKHLIGDCKETLKTLEPESVNCIVTSPPYFAQRSYLKSDDPKKVLEIGNEKTPEEYIKDLVTVFDECKRVLKQDGTMYVIIGDTYNTGKFSSIVKNKDLLGIPFMLAFALRDNGWYWRDTIIWAKGISGKIRMGVCMPESVVDRTNKSHEYILMFSKSDKYFYDSDAIKEDGSESSKTRANSITHLDKQKDGSEQFSIKPENVKKYLSRLAKKIEDPNFEYKVTRRSVWLCMPSRASNVKHSAVYPRELIEPIILSSCPQGGTVLDPFGGSGTTAVVAEYLGRNAINCELNDNGKELYFERKAEIERQMKNNNQIKEKDVVAVVKQKLEVKTAKGRTLW